MSYAKRSSRARVARKLPDGTGHRAALWFNALGMADLVVAMILGALVGYRLISIGPASSPISALPLALIPSAAVPLLFALHITSPSALRTISGARTRATANPSEPGPILLALDETGTERSSAAEQIATMMRH
jgi:hypothetical protein